MSPAIVGLDAAGAAAAWRAGGLSVEAEEAGEPGVGIGSVRVRIGGRGAGLTGWTLAGIPPATTAVDGLPTRVADPVGAPSAAPAVAHPNRANQPRPIEPRVFAGRLVTVKLHAIEPQQLDLASDLLG